MSELDKKEGLDRRSFLRGVGLSAGAAGAGAAVMSGSKSAEAAVDGAGKKAAGYQETELVRQAYELSRF